MRRDLLIGLFLFLAAIAVFGRTVVFDFVNFDDPLYVSENPHVRRGLTWEGAGWALRANLCSKSPNADFWIPLTFLSHMLAAEISGAAPWGHHLLNVLLHGINAALLFLALRRMTDGFWRSAFVAALFALHPLHVESVAWVTERKDVLCAFFWMLTLLAYDGYARKPGLLRYSLVAFALILGLLSKPIVMTLPFVLLLLDVWPLQRVSIPALELNSDSSSTTGWRRALAEKVPLIGIALVFAVITLVAQRRTGALKTLETFPLSARVANAVVAYGAYLEKTVWPARLAVFYPHAKSALPVWRVVFSALLLTCVTVLAIAAIRRRPYIPVGWFWYLGALFPTIGIVQTGEQAMADRYTYLPLIGIFVIFAWGLVDMTAHWRRRRASVAFTAAGVIVLCSAAAWQQSGYWRDSITLFSHALEVTSGNYVAHNNLAAAYENKGDITRAIEHYEAALRIKPAYLKARNNLAGLYAMTGKTNLAIEQSVHALQDDPASVDALVNLGTILVEQGETTQGTELLSKALRIDPSAADARYNLGLVLERTGRNDEARTEYKRALSDAETAGNDTLAREIRARTEEFGVRGFSP